MSEYFNLITFISSLSTKYLFGCLNLRPCFTLKRLTGSVISIALNLTSVRGRTSEGKAEEEGESGYFHYSGASFPIRFCLWQLFVFRLFISPRLVNFALTDATMEIEKEVKKVSSPPTPVSADCRGNAPTKVCWTPGRWREKLRHHRKAFLWAPRLSL